jgi:hypothetical protein
VSIAIEREGARQRSAAVELLAVAVTVNWSDVSRGSGRNHGGCDGLCWFEIYGGLWCFDQGNVFRVIKDEDGYNGIMVMVIVVVFYVESD